MFVVSRPRQHTRTTSAPILSSVPPLSPNPNIDSNVNTAAGSERGVGLGISDGGGGGGEAGGNPNGRRQLYYAVREGHKVGVFDNWDDAEASIKDFDFPEWKTFKTLLAAEAFIAGGSGSSSFSVTRNANRKSMPAPYKVRYGTPAASAPVRPAGSKSPVNARHQLPLHERLERHFPPSVPASSSTNLRPRMGHRPKSLPLSGLAPSPHISKEQSGPTDFGPLKPPRPAFARRSSGSSSGSSPVRRSSPLRQEVTDDEDTDNDTASVETDDSAEPSELMARRTPTITLRGLMTPPISPVEPAASGSRRSRTEELDRAGTGRSLFPASPMTLREVGRKSERPHSVQPTLKRMESDSSLGSVGSESSVKGRKVTSAPGGLWGDSPSAPVASPSKLSQAPLLSPPFSPDRAEGSPDLVNVLELDPSLAATSAPKFSRSALKRADILMPLSPKQLSPVVSPTRSPTISKSPSMLSLLKSSKRSPSLAGSLDSLHDRLESLSAVSGSSTGQENARPLKPPMSRSTSGLSMSSTGSDRTFSSLATAKYQPGSYETNVVDLAETPLDTATGQSMDRAETPISAMFLDQAEPQDELLEPIKSIPSSDATSIQASVATHTQSENCLDRGKGSKFGRKGSKGEKSGGIGKKILKAFGFGSGSATSAKAESPSRRSSN